MKRIKKQKKIVLKKEQLNASNFPSVSNMLDLTFLEDKTLSLCGEIGEGPYELDQLVKKIKYLTLKRVDRITIDIDSPGGSVYGGFAIINTILEAKKLGIEVVGRVVGMAASMAAVVLSVCTHRIAMPFSTVMIHEVSQFKFGSETVSMSKDNQIEMERVNEMLLSVIAKYTGRTLNQVTKDVHKKDLYMLPEEAKKYGIIDEILDLE